MAAESAKSGEYAMASADLRALLNAAVDAIVVIDEAGRIRTFNAAAERLFGYSAEEAVDANVDLLMAEPDRSQHALYIKRYLQGGEPRIIGVGREVQGRRKSGEVFPISLSVGEARDGAGRRFVGIIRDLSSQREAEQRARSLEARLAHMGRFSLMGEMAAGIAHEINQPLSAIATYAQAAKRLMQREQPDLTVLTDICRKVDEQALRAGQVIENLRKFIRKQDIEQQRLDVNRVVAAVVDLIEADARAEGIRVRTEYAPDLPTVRSNAIQLQEVLLNLTRNSVDAMRKGMHKDQGIVIATEATEGGGVRIVVMDHGHGVSRQLGDNIFHPFITTKVDGLGVGLAISRTIVQSYGGSLTYRDNPDGGAIFLVELPPEKDATEAPLDESGRTARLSR
jgi:two-component system sensor kinase FixL